MINCEYEILSFLRYSLHFSFQQRVLGMRIIGGLITGDPMRDRTAHVGRDLTSRHTS